MLKNFVKAGAKKMPIKHHKETRVVGYSVPFVYKVVADVENYKNFVPWCKSSTIIHRKESSRALKLEIVANLEVSFAGIITEKYNSHVLLHPNKLVKAKAVGTHLFEILDTKWEFKPDPEHPKEKTIIDFDLKYSFKSSFHNNLSDMFFNEVVNKMISAFEKEFKRQSLGKKSQRYI